MNKTTSKSNLKILISALALISFIAFALCRSFIGEPNAFQTYSWRITALNDLFLAIPYLALFVFSLLQRKLTRLHKNTAVFGFLLLQFIQTLLILPINGSFGFSVFCCSMLGKYTESILIFFAVRTAVLLLLPFFQRRLLRFYSIGMIAFFALYLIGILLARAHFLRYSLAEVIFGLIVDLLLYVALFFFGDLLDQKTTKKRIESHE